MACLAQLNLTITRDLKDSKQDGDDASTMCLVELILTYNRPLLVADVIQHHRINTATGTD